MGWRNMTKLYMVWDEISNTYFSEVAGVTREENKDNAYIYDKKHATQVLQDVLKAKRTMENHLTYLILWKCRLI